MRGFDEESSKVPAQTSSLPLVPPEQGQGRFGHAAGKPETSDSSQYAQAMTRFPVPEPSLPEHSNSTYTSQSTVDNTPIAPSSMPNITKPETSGLGPPLQNRSQSRSSFNLIDLEDALPEPREQNANSTSNQVNDSIRESRDNPSKESLKKTSTTPEKFPPLPPKEQSLLDVGPDTINDSAPSRPIDTSKHAETYEIRHVNWTDSTTKLRRSPILVQNENGPCPLLALVNGLVLRATQSPITKALQTRERISLGLLIEVLFDELISYAGGESQLPDIEALSSFLTMLHTGMNVNPRLIPV